MSARKSTRHIKLTSHPGQHGPKPIPIVWGARDPAARGPVIATVSDPGRRNAIGTHSGSYAVYRALAVASGTLDPDYRPDFTDTAPTDAIGPYPQWFDSEADAGDGAAVPEALDAPERPKRPHRIVSLDPFGAVVSDVFADYFARGYHIQPTIAITKAHIQLPEIADAVEMGRLEPDGELLRENGFCVVTKAAIEPVWYLPGVARRFDCSESDLRRTLFEQTAGMFPELVTRGDLDVFLPPIGGQTAYIFGPVSRIADPDCPLAVRVHDECNGSDVFGSDICTCRPYLVHGIEECIRAAQRGGAGVIVYFRKEGRALGEVTKFLVYNARKRQRGGDRAAEYFNRTECVAGVQDMRFQELMPDVLHWLGITRIDRLISMSNLKYDAIVGSGIEVVRRVRIPDEMIPPDARVEIDAKMAAGYYTDGDVPGDDELAKPKGRGLDR